MVAAGFAACRDEAIFDDSDIGTGTVTMIAAVEFEPQASALDSRATSGTAMRDIRSLSVVIYNSDTTLHRIVNYDASELSVEYIEGNRPSDFAGSAAESSTARATFVLPELNVGRYYIYAVANMGALTDDDATTPHRLKTRRLEWDKSNPGSNDQMFGYFTPEDYDQSIGYDAPLVTVSRKSPRIHSWLKRAASKVTVVYDPSGLHNEIFVYIHKVTIRDIPRRCLLGADNQPTDSTVDLEHYGESIYYDRSSNQLDYDPAPSVKDYAKWMRLGRGSGKHGAVDEEGNLHPQTSPAMYFYENVQDPRKEFYGRKEYDKRQDWDSVGFVVNRPGQPDYKDNVPCGTYIEVEGFYISEHEPVITSGSIKYRFMLGQDAEYDYNAWRNRHYKVTLGFKGYANQPDWHIEYIEDNPELYVPSEYYVSYLYNHKSQFPVRVIGDCTKLECEIIQNDWHPYDEDGTDNVPDEGEIGTGGESFKWNHEVWKNSGNYTTASGGYYYGRHKVRYDAGTPYDTTMYITPPHAGFLALTVPVSDESKQLPATIFNGTTHNFSTNYSIAALKNYYYANESSSDGGAVSGGYGSEINTTPQNKRTYSLTAGSHDSGRNEYIVEDLDDGTKTLQIPIWTRPKSMIRISGFSGNNPYETYMRKSVVRIRATFNTPHGSVVRVKDVPVFQARRIVNPKGIWRKYNDDDDFQVTLLQRRSAGSATFEKFKSEGSWKAYISTTNGKKFCSLSGGVAVSGDTIFGDTDTPVDFTIKFNGITGEDDSNCAIVEVLYHGFNCSHTVFVRQGYYKPLAIVNNGAKWCSFALYAAEHPYKDPTGQATGVVTKNPLALGNLFKRGNLSEGLLHSNHAKYPKLADVGDDAEFDLADVNGVAKSNTWGKIYGANVYDAAGNQYDATHKNMTYSWPEIKATVHGEDRVYRLPTYDDYDALSKGDCGLGVFYSDGASETATAMSTAYGYLDVENKGEPTQCGMRGIVAYNSSNGNQIFFPVGVTGVGRRTLQGTTSASRGTLRYGATSKVLSVANNSANQYRPICYNLPASPGAIYWIRTRHGNCMGWDMNYFDFTFGAYDQTTGFYDNGDALPIKLIRVE